MVAGEDTREDATSHAHDQQRSERLLLATWLNAPAALCAVADRRGTIVHCNQRFREVLAVRSDPADALRNPMLRGADAIIAFAVAGSEAKSLEVDLELEVDGAIRFLHFSASAQSLPGLGDCTVMMGHDETRRHQERQAILHSRTLVTLGEMTTGIAHELSQPLNVIRMAAQNALTEIRPDPDETANAVPAPWPEQRSFIAGKLDRIVAQVDRAAAIISRMRIFGRSSDQPPSAFDVRAACRGALMLVDQQLRNSGIQCIEALGSQPVLTFGHQNLLEQAILNLLFNARDALRKAPRRDKTIEIAVAAIAPNRVVVRVADNGPGIPPQIRDRIFEPFFTANPVGQGTGLGLAIAFGIVSDAGGTLTLKPSEDGAVFEIELPMAAAPEKGELTSPGGAAGVVPAP
jgi:signal transduction histidine kinase